MSGGIEARAAALLEEAAAMGLIGLLFECPRGDWRERVAALSAEVKDGSLAAAASAACSEASEGLYHTILGPGGTLPPREVSHRGSVIPGGMLADLEAFYDAFAYRPECREAPDHVAVEAGFLGYLRIKEAYAVLRGEDEQAAVTGEAARRFAAEHLASIAGPLASCAESAGVEYLARAAGALLQRVGAARASPPATPLTESADEGCVFDCGCGGPEAGGEDDP